MGHLGIFELLTKALPVVHLFPSMSIKCLWYFFLPIYQKTIIKNISPFPSHPHSTWSFMSRNMEPLSVGRVVGDIVDGFIPSVKMSVIYNSNKQVANGHEMMPSVVTAKPRVDIGGEDLRAAYTLVSFDNNVPLSSLYQTLELISSFSMIRS